MNISVANLGENTTWAAGCGRESWNSSLLDGDGRLVRISPFRPSSSSIPASQIQPVLVCGTIEQALPRAGVASHWIEWSGVEFVDNLSRAALPGNYRFRITFAADDNRSVALDVPFVVSSAGRGDAAPPATWVGYAASNSSQGLILAGAIFDGNVTATKRELDGEFIIVNEGENATLTSICGSEVFFAIYDAAGKSFAMRLDHDPLCLPDYRFLPAHSSLRIPFRWDTTIIAMSGAAEALGRGEYLLSCGLAQFTLGPSGYGEDTASITIPFSVKGG